MIRQYQNFIPAYPAERCGYNLSPSLTFKVHETKRRCMRSCTICLAVSKLYSTYFSMHACVSLIDSFEDSHCRTTERSQYNMESGHPFLLAPKLSSNSSPINI